MKPVYPAEITKDEKGFFFARFLDFDEAITDGESMEEALFNAQEVLTLTIEGRMDEGIAIPDPQPATGKNIHFIAPAARGRQHCSCTGQGGTAALRTWPAPLKRLGHPQSVWRIRTIPPRSKCLTGPPQP
jgi:predicted RNase H-like HicB family nuclease